MLTRHRLCVAALLLIPLCAIQVAAQSTSVDIEAGYQWLDIDGNEEMYRTQVDEDDGFVLRSFSLSRYTPIGETGENSLFDRLRIDAAGFGGNPSGRLRLQAGRADLYNLRLLYQRFESFSALPALANPALGDGIIPGQHTFDRDRQLLDLEVELLPGRTITPLLGLRWNRFEGPRRTTYHVGQDEFRLDSRLRETERELRAGLSFVAGHFRGVVMQGWRDFDGRETLALTAGAGDGNSLDTVLGRDVGLDQYGRVVRSEAETPITTAYVSGRLGGRIQLTASYVRADAEAETADEELLTGSLVSFSLGRLFEGLQESVSARSESPSWRGQVKLRADVTSTLSLDARFTRHSRRLEGWALVSSLYLGTLDFSGTTTGDISRLLETETGFDRDETVLDLRLEARELGPFRCWAGWSQTDQDLELAADVAQIVVPGGQWGSFDRGIDTYALGVAVSLAGIEASLDWRDESADEAIVRNHFLDRDRLRLRLGWSFSGKLRLLGTAERLDADNLTTGIASTTEIRHYGADLQITPLADLVLHLAYDSYTTDSEALLRVPQDFSQSLSLHSEDGQAVEAGVGWKRGRFGVDAAYSAFENSGSFAFDLDRLLARFSYDLSDSMSASLELEEYDYAEIAQATLGDFEATRYGLFLRWHN